MPQLVKNVEDPLEKATAWAEWMSRSFLHEDFAGTFVLCFTPLLELEMFDPRPTKIVHSFDGGTPTTEVTWCPS